MEEADNPEGGTSHQPTIDDRLRALENRPEKTTVDLYNLRRFLGLLLFTFSVVPDEIDYTYTWISLALIFMSPVEVKINRLIIKL